MKRGNDNSQMSKVRFLQFSYYGGKILLNIYILEQEEYEAQEDADNDDEGMTPGTFKRASADVIAGRKIIKVKR